MSLLSITTIWYETFCVYDFIILTLGNIRILQVTGIEIPLTSVVNISLILSGSFNNAAPIPPYNGQPIYCSQTWETAIN